MSTNKFLEVAQKGILYDPANLRYKDIKVICDLCKKTDLKVCISYESIDLCTECVNETLIQDAAIKKKNEINNLNRTRIHQGHFRNDNIMNIVEQARFIPTYNTNVPETKITSSVIDRVQIKTSNFSENEDSSFNKIYGCK